MTAVFHIREIDIPFHLCFIVIIIMYRATAEPNELEQQRTYYD